MRNAAILSILLLLAALSAAGPIDIVRLKYGGGGDWYNDPDEELNLLREFGQRTGVEVRAEKVALSASDEELFRHPFLFITGHGEVRFTEHEVRRLRLYLESGGFLYADDDFGMDPSFRRELKRIFPDRDLAELPADFPIYSCFYDMPPELPKIHEHQAGRPSGLGLFSQGRLAVYYTYNTNISDGWTAVHGDPAGKREQAFRIGVNILWYALTNR